MAKPRPTLPIAHADDLPTSAFTDEDWQTIERAYGRHLNADVRQQITTVTSQYSKDCVFERTAAPKAIAYERIERIRRAAGGLEKVLRDSKPFSASTDDLARKQQQQQEHEQQEQQEQEQQEQEQQEQEQQEQEQEQQEHEQQEQQEQEQQEQEQEQQEQEQEQEQQEQQRSATDYLIGRYFNDPRLVPGWRGDHLRGVLRSLVFACDCVLNDLDAAEGSGDGQAWDWWIQSLTQIVQRHDLPYGARIVETSGQPSPFVALVRALGACAGQAHVFGRRTG
jgi:hypothetical protein